jgi:hypothetical protein
LDCSKKRSADRQTSFVCYNPGVSRLLTIGLILVFLAGCTASWIPLPRRLDLVENDVLTAKLGRVLRIDAPQQLRPDETGWLDLTVIAAKDSGPAVITTRLDLPGLSAETEDRGQVVAADGEAHFRWKLLTQKSGVYAGRLWIYAGSERELVAAQDDLGLAGSDWFFSCGPGGLCFRSRPEPERQENPAVKPGDTDSLPFIR